MFKKLLVVFIVLSQIVIAQNKSTVAAQGDTLVIEPLGDSITRGTEGVTYRQYLKELLKGIGIPTNFVGECTNAANSGSVWADYPDLYKTLEGDIQHDGYGGLKINELTDMTYNTRGYPKKTIQQLVKDNPSDVILLMIGTNDIISNYLLSAAPVRLDTLITRILRSTNHHLIVTTITPTPLPIANGKIQTYNAAIPAIVEAHKAKGEKISFIDINATMGSSDISSDSYHPNKQGYEKIGQGFFEAIKSILTTDIQNEEGTELPSKFGLMQNYPNPFNPVTTINYSIPKSTIVNLEVFDVLGRRLTTLVNKYQEVGNYQIQFDASNFASGVYYYMLATENFRDVKKMTILK